MRFMAEAVPERFAGIAAGFGVAFDSHDPRRGALACADRAAAFIAQFSLPMRLRDVGIPESEIGDVASHVLGVLEGANVIGRRITRADVIGLLTAAY
jgi:alcohol dehydrogenase class IV